MSDENVGGLVAKWREAAKQAYAAQGKVTKYGCAYAVVFRDCADELEAALSAHGQPVVDGRYFADGPQGWFVTDNLELARALVSAYDKNDDWTVTDIGYVAGALG